MSHSHTVNWPKAQCSAENKLPPNTVLYVQCSRMFRHFPQVLHLSDVCGQSRWAHVWMQTSHVVCCMCESSPDLIVHTLFRLHVWKGLMFPISLQKMYPSSHAFSLPSSLSLPWTPGGIEIRQWFERILVWANMSVHPFFLFSVCMCVDLRDFPDLHMFVSVCVHCECVYKEASESVLGLKPLLQVQNKHDLSHINMLCIFTNTV